MAFYLFLAGEADPTTDAFVTEKGYPRLLSYAYQKKTIGQYCKAKENGYSGMLMVDSGAFTAYRQGKPVSLDEYIGFINHHPQADRFVELDHIPGSVGGERTAEETEEGAQKSYANYLYMLQRVNCPEKIMAVYHEGENISHLERILLTKLPDGSYPRSVCVSYRKDKGDPTNKIGFVANCFKAIQRVGRQGVEVHVLGCGIPQILESQPLFSADYSTWILTGSNGSVMTENFGMVCVSDRGAPNSVEHMPPEARKRFVEYVKSLGFEYGSLVADYRQRWKFNALQVQLLAQGVSHRPHMGRTSLF